MGHPKYGNKFTCYECGARFYDMKAAKPMCPKCGANQKKAPKSTLSKSSKSVFADLPADNLEEDFEPGDVPEVPTERGLDEFPIKEREDETFEAEDDQIRIIDVSSDEY